MGDMSVILSSDNERMLSLLVFLWIQRAMKMPPLLKL